MARTTPDDHPLRGLFRKWVEKVFLEEIQWKDQYVLLYLSDLMAEFVHMDRLYPLRGPRGQRIEQISEMLAESDVRLNASSFEREREVHKYIGDYILFMTGIFPEYLKRLKIAQMILSPDYLVDYIKVGKRSYRIVSEFHYGPFKQSSPLYRKLSENFEVCITGLGSVRKEMDRVKDLKNRCRPTATDPPPH